MRYQLHVAKSDNPLLATCSWYYQLHVAAFDYQLGNRTRKKNLVNVGIGEKIHFLRFLNSIFPTCSENLTFATFFQFKLSIYG
jgi:hypothetical protein